MLPSLLTNARADWRACEVRGESLGRGSVTHSVLVAARQVAYSSPSVAIGFDRTERKPIADTSGLGFTAWGVVILEWSS